MNSKSHILILTVACILISGFYFWIKPVVESTDTIDYLKLSENLAQHQEYSLQDNSPFIPAISRAPLYSTFIALVTFGTNNKQLIVFAQILLGVLSVLIFYLIALHLTSEFAAFAGACFYLLYPARISSINTILTESVFTFLLLGGVYLILLFLKTKHQRYIIAGGFIFGLASLCRPIALSFALVLITILIITEYKLLHEKLFYVALPFLLTMVVVIAPWSIRNSIVSNQFVLIQSSGPASYYIPTRFDINQSDEATLWKVFNEEDEYGKKITAAVTPADYLEADKPAFGLAIKNIKSNPSAYIFSRLKFYPRLFISSFDSFTGYNRSFSDALFNKEYLVFLVKLGLLVLFSLLPLVGAIFGFYKNIKNKTVFIIACGWIFTLLIHIPLWIEYRFWIPAFPFVILTALTNLKVRPNIV